MSALTDRQRRLTLDMPEAAALLGIARSTAYELVARGEFPIPTLRFGRRIVVARAELARALGVDEAAIPEPEAETG